MTDVTTIEITLSRVITHDGQLIVRLQKPPEFNAVEILGLIETAKFLIYQPNGTPMNHYCLRCGLPHTGNCLRPPQHRQHTALWTALAFLAGLITGLAASTTHTPPPPPEIITVHRTLS